jgi:transcriptional regulator with GAF, ATPase, and Fis domain
MPSMAEVTHDPATLARLDALAELLPVLAGALDVRDVFHHISRITREVLPHDALALALVSDDRQSLHIYALSSDVDFARPDRILVPPDARDLLTSAWDFLIVDDLTTDPFMRTLPPAAAGLRASLRVPLHREGQLIGGVNFLSERVGVFTPADVPVAQRVAAYIGLTLSHQRLADAAARAAEARERAQMLERHVEALQEELVTLGRLPRRIVGGAPAWRRVMTEAAKVAPTETTVLITGASGTGKEVVARFIHGASPRAGGPFVAINCAAIPETLIESELFGTERGAYTGAAQARAGHLERAAGGVLFLDEVGELSPGAQAKLLRVLQEREFLRLGSSRPRPADVRVIAATNHELTALVEQGRFREDLLYRLDVFSLDLPLLRDRPDDIIPLSVAFLEDIGRHLARPAAGLSRDARPVLLAYGWPGNVRELRNVLERASILADGGLITSQHLHLHDRADRMRAASPAPRAPALPPAARAIPPAAPLAAVERQMVEDALRAARFNKTLAAERLGLTRSQLYVRLRRYGLDRYEDPQDEPK